MKDPRTKTTVVTVVAVVKESRNLMSIWFPAVRVCNHLMEEKWLQRLQATRPGATRRNLARPSPHPAFRMCSLRTFST